MWARMKADGSSISASASATAARSRSRSSVRAALGQQAGARCLDHRTGVVDVLEGRAPVFEDHARRTGRRRVPSGVCTRAPPRAPRRTLISDSDSSTRNASRSVGRETANSAIRAVSAGSASPSASSPRTILRRSCAATSSAILGTRTGAVHAPTATALPSRRTRHRAHLRPTHRCGTQPEHRVDGQLY